MAKGIKKIVRTVNKIARNPTVKAGVHAGTVVYKNRKAIASHAKTAMKTIKAIHDIASAASGAGAGAPVPM
jgi:hypothetical protein